MKDKCENELGKGSFVGKIVRKGLQKAWDWWKREEEGMFNR